MPATTQSWQLPAVVFAACAACLAGAAFVPGQAPPGQPVPAHDGVVGAELRAALQSRLQLGCAAREAGRFSEARDHFLSALSFGEASPELLRELLATSVAAKDADARLIWSVRLAAATADGSGRFRPAREDLSLLEKGQKLPGTLALARGRAVEELARFASGRRGRDAVGDGVMARWASDFAWQLMRRAPALQREHGPVLNDACASRVADYATVLQALRKVAAGAIKPKPTGQATAPTEQELDEVIIRAARCLTGMAAQAKFKDRKGPPPPSMTSETTAARQARARVRARINGRVGGPLTLEQLRASSAEDRERFTAAHATWANPGVGVSPTGRYRVETVCGFETLLGVIETVEMHHARLAGFFGKDPFGGRQGLVRIVPASTGLESEDAPYWWAGGFQQGDRTTVKFHWSNHESLGHLLTHELTHRFDGTIFPFQPSWLVEGKAVWTGGSYRIAEDEEFVDRLLRIGPCSTAFVKGYGGPGKLQKLIEGTIDDYRDNYTAGYALYVFLATWRKSGDELFAARLRRFMQNARAGRGKPLAWFVNMFADGKGGRPKGLPAFAGMFRGFLHGCYQAGWGEPPAWIRGYRRTFRRRGGKRRNTRRGTRQRGTVMDEPTWIWNRERAEPWFGQRHAAAAGLLLDELGQPGPAIAALLWSLGTDDWQMRAARRLARLLDDRGHRAVAWAVRAELAHRGIPGAADPTRSAGRSGARGAGAQGAPSVASHAPLGEAPMLAKLPRVRAWFAALRTAAAECQAKGRSRAARQLLLLHDRDCWRVGLPAVPLPAPAPRTVRTEGGAESSNGILPDAAMPRYLGVFGWTEAGLTGYEERRVRGLWYQAANGDVHVGRRRPRKDSGLLDRTAYQRHAFVQSAEWFGPGSYVFKTRVHFTTSFVSGAIILGYARRDRYVRLGFSAGDFLYSIGRKQDTGSTERVKLDLGGKWIREGYLRPTRRRQYRFERPASSFAVEARVRGATVRVYVEGKYQFSYTTPDLSPILGSIGVAMGQGAVRLQNPTVQRLDRAPGGPLRGQLGGSPGGARNHATQVLGRRFEGVPLHPDGTVVVWLPGLVLDDEDFDYERWATKAMERLVPMVDDKLRYPQAWALMIPRRLPASTKKQLAGLAAKRGFRTGEHDVRRPLIDSVFGMYVDARGGVRVVTDLLRQGVGVPDALERWARVSRRPRGSDVPH